ncbi:competence protein CoiA family protein [Desulfurobacterium sp.]
MLLVVVKVKIYHFEGTMESREHEEVKQRILRACQKLGWHADTEVNLKGLVPDVLARKDNLVFAFEVQWRSSGGSAVYNKLKKYQKLGIQSVWFFRTDSGCLRDSSFPAFRLLDTEFVQIGEMNFLVEEVVSLILQGKVVFRKCFELRRDQKVAIYKFPMRCWKCGRITNVVEAFGNYKSVCGCSLFNISVSDEDLGSYLSLLQKSGFRALRDVGPIKKRYSKTTGEWYWSNGCKWCGVIIGKHYVMDELLEYVYEGEPSFEVEFRLKRTSTDYFYPHWCFQAL